MNQVELPPIEDNAKGVSMDTLCTVRVWGSDGKYYHMQAVPRGLLEADFMTIGNKLVQLADKAGGLLKIKVEVCTDGTIGEVNAY